MPGIIFDIKRFAVHDGPGIRTTVFLKECSLRCKWCHNPESWQAAPETVNKKTLLDGRLFTEVETIGREVSVAEVMAEIEKERLIMEESGGGITFSGGEPLMQLLFLKELLGKCVEAGFHTAVDTSGNVPKSDFEAILPFTRLFLYDLKLMDDILHQQFTGVSNRKILENFRYVVQSGKQIRVRVPMIKGITATKENIGQIYEFIAPFASEIVQIDLLPYHWTGKNKYEKLGILCEMPDRNSRPEKSEMERFRLIFEKGGFKVKIGG
jgi:pyruvate formate lyase activating enzyme